MIVTTVTIVTESLMTTILPAPNLETLSLHLFVAIPEFLILMKLRYLLSSHKVEGKALVKTLPVTEVNFEVAWDLLCKRYMARW